MLTATRFQTKRSNRSGLHRLAGPLAVLPVVADIETLIAPVAEAASFMPVSGSTSSSNALDQWRRNVVSLHGLTVNNAPNGSTSGRMDFRSSQVDFAVSEITHGLTDCEVLDPPPTRFEYMHIVAGGTSLTYDLDIGGKWVTNLWLPGEIIVRISTQQIINWSDPAITADNPNLTLPGHRTVLVTYSNGSSTCAQLTTWMADQRPAMWNAYRHQVGRNIMPCEYISFYPHDNNVVTKAQSQGVAGSVAQDPADLTQKLQTLVGVDPWAYPLSSYSYMILPERHFGNQPGAFIRYQG